jgi:formylglycine-generating enzyme
MSSIIEQIARDQGWVVKNAADGTPSFFYPIYKCTSQSLDASLPATTHPAFIVNGVEIPRVLVGVYKGVALNSAAHSLPNMPPQISLGHDQLRSLCKAAGPGFTGKTVAISGLLYLMAKKNSWVPKGNNSYSVDYRDGTPWELAKAYTTGNKRVLWGWEYECLANHTSEAANRPDVAPHLWARGKKIGGSPVASQITSAVPNGYNTLTGSGPLSWTLDGKVSGITDLNGNCAEQDFGYRVYDGELQILENNNALHPDADLAAASTAWKAILPSAIDTSYTLVAPGTAGTLKWDKSGTYPVLDTAIAVRTTGEETMSRAFKDLTANAANVPFIPTILQELGIFPIAGDTTQGTVYYRNHATTEYIPRRGGNFTNTSGAGLGFVHCSYSRSFANSYYGVRPAFYES